MFEVGKKYKVVHSKAIRECLWIGDGRVLMSKSTDGSYPSPCLVDIDYSYNWEEYAGPKKIVKELYVKTNGIDTVWCVDYPETNLIGGLLGKIRLTHTEGQGLTVEVIE